MAGTITDNPLSNVATTINSAGFVDLPTVDATNHLILILDPTEANGPAEIVRVTAHTAAASSVTVVRGAEGSAARAHILGTTWFFGPVTSDFTEVLTSSTRPAVPYEGELIYETDTNKLVGFGGVDWAPRDAGGQLGYTEVNNLADQQDSSAGTETDATNLTVTVTVGTGRRIKITVKGQVFSTILDDACFIRTKEGATTLMLVTMNRLNGSASQYYEFSATVTPTAGMHTYKVSFQRAVGTGRISHRSNALEPSFIRVEDIGAA